MEITSEIRQILNELEFDEKWFSFGFVSTEKLQELWKNFQIGDDNNKEHFRWAAFTYYLDKQKEIDENSLRELYQLSEVDADNYGMGISMRIQILQRKNCPADLLNKALNSGEKPLVKVVSKKLNLEYK